MPRILIIGAHSGGRETFGGGTAALRGRAAFDVQFVAPTGSNAGRYSKDRAIIVYPFNKG